jgi:hypothetical protein
MRPNSMWSDYESRAHRQWMSTSKPGAGSSLGPKILLAALVVVAAVIGISGIYPRVIDAEWTQDSGPHLPKISLLTTSTTMKASATATALPLRARHVVTTGHTAGSPPRLASAPEGSQLRTSVAAIAPVPEAAAPRALAEVPDAQAKVDALATQTLPTKAVDKQTKVVKRKVAQHHQRSSAGAYAQYGGWGWSGFGGRF